MRTFATNAVMKSAHTGHTADIDNDRGAKMLNDDSSTDTTAIGTAIFDGGKRQLGGNSAIMA